MGLCFTFVVSVARLSYARAQGRLGPNVAPGISLLNIIWPRKCGH